MSGVETPPVQVDVTVTDAMRDWFADPDHSSSYLAVVHLEGGPVVHVRLVDEEVE